MTYPTERRHTSGLVRTDKVLGRAIRPPTLWRAFAGLGVWAVCFTALYTAHALICVWIDQSTGQGSALSLITHHVAWSLSAIWLFFIVWLLVLSLRSGRWLQAIHYDHHVLSESMGHTERAQADCDPLKEPDSAGWVMIRRRSLRFMVILTFVTDVSSVIVTIVSGLPIILTPVCL